MTYDVYMHFPVIAIMTLFVSRLIHYVVSLRNSKLSS